MTGEKPTENGTSRALGPIVQALEGMAQHVRPLVLLCAIVGLLGIGGSSVGLQGTARVAVSLGSLGVILVGLVMLYRLASTSPLTDRAEADLSSVRRAFEAVNGPWWQFAISDEEPGLTLLEVRLSPIPNNHRISGRKWNPAGRAIATFGTEAVGIRRVDPVEVFYYWEGAYTKEIGIVSGVGFFEFDTRTGTGTGWFTTGHADAGDFRRTTKVHLRKPTDEEKTVLQREGERLRELVTKTYASWAAELSIDK